MFLQKRFKRVRQFEDEDEADEGEGEDREAIANELFEGGSDQVIFISYIRLYKELYVDEINPFSNT